MFAEHGKRQLKLLKCSWYNYGFACIFFFGTKYLIQNCTINWIRFLEWHFISFGMWNELLRERSTKLTELMMFWDLWVKKALFHLLVILRLFFFYKIRCWEFVYGFEVLDLINLENKCCFAINFKVSSNGTIFEKKNMSKPFRVFYGLWKSHKHFRFNMILTHSDCFSAYKTYGKTIRATIQPYGFL